jgi:hypothetical protein
MTKRNTIQKFLVALTIPAFIISCDKEDGPHAIATDFGSIASSGQEREAEILTIPLRNANASIVSKLNVSFGGSATEGEDYTFLGLTQEGVQIQINDDQLLEEDENIRVQLTATGMNLNGNTIHQIIITDDCEDEGGLTLANFAGGYTAIEKYGPEPADWASPYHLNITQDATNPARFNMTNFYGSNLPAYFLVDIATKSVYFPDQKPHPSFPLTNSSGTFDFCTHDGHLTLTIQLNFDGGDWEYELMQD